MLCCFVSVVEAKYTQKDLLYELNSGSVTVGGIEDSDGVIWLATAIGPLRYDGVTREFLKAESDIRLSRVGSIFEDRDGRIWFGRATGGLVVHNKSDHSFQRILHDPDNPNSLSSNNLNWAPHLIQQGKNGDIWVGTANGLNRISPEGNVTGYFHDPNDGNSLVGDNIQAVFIDSSENIWIATDVGLSVLSISSKKFTNYRHHPDDENSIPAGSISDIVEERPGVMWVSSHANGLARLQVNTGNIKRFEQSAAEGALSHNEIYSLTQDQRGLIWLGRSFSVAVGVESFDPQLERFQTYLRNPDSATPEPNETIMSVFIGNGGTVWLPYNHGPLYRILPAGPIYPARLRDNTPAHRHVEPVLVIAEDAHGEIWLGGVGGLKKYDPKTRSYYYWRAPEEIDDLKQRGISFGEVNTILPVGENRLWIGEVNSRFSLLDTQSGEVLKTYSSNVRAFGVWGGVLDPEDPNFIWFGTQTHGLGCLDTRNGKFKYFNAKYNPDAGIETNFIAKVLPASKKGLWLASDGQGVLLFKDDAVVDQFTNHDGDSSSLASAFVNDIEFDQDGRMWVATMEGGLNLLKPKSRKFERFGAEAGLTTRSIFGIEIDSEGMLWLATAEGVFIFNPYEKRVERHITSRDYLHTDSLLTWPTGTFMSDKQELFLGSLSGMSVISLPTLIAQSSEPVVIFSSVNVNGESLEGQINLERLESFDVHGPNATFDFSVSVLGYAYQARRDIRYKLDGYEEAWVTPDSNFYGRYTGLKRGSYTLIVQGSQGGGEWSDGTRVRVNVYPAFWELSEFYIALVLLAAAVASLMIIYRLRVLKKLIESANALAESENRLRDIGEVAFDYFFETDKNHRITFLSEKFQTITGVSPEKIYGKTRWEATTEDVVGQKWHEHRQCLSNHEPFHDFRFCIPGPDNKGREILGNGKPIFSKNKEFKGYVGTGRDITAQVMAEKNALDAKRRLLGAIESANASIFVFNLNNELEFSHVAKLMNNQGLFDGVREGMSHVEFVQAVLVPRIEKIPNISSDQFVQRLINHHLDSSTAIEIKFSNQIWLQLNETILDDGGSIQFWTECTMLKQHEERELRSQKLHAVGQLTGGISHDFNNLLAVIQSNLELLLETRKDLDSESREYIKSALSATGKGSELTQRMLTFTRQQSLKPEEVDVNQVISEMISMLRRTLSETISIHWNAEKNLWKCNIDPSHFEGAILNLIVNAKDAMPDGGNVTIESSNKKVTMPIDSLLDKVKPGEYVLIKVVDTGEGMSQSILNRIFDPFFTTKDIGKGTGLGLSMVYGFIKQSQGYALCESIEGLGTEFSLLFPVSQSSHRTSEEVLAVKATILPPGLRILIVEDNVSVRKSIARMLELKGCSIVVADDATKALELIENRTNIDLVVTDIGLPNGRNGLELAQEICTIRPQMPIVCISGYQRFSGSNSVLDKEELHFVQKPFSSIELHEAIAKAYAKKGSRCKPPKLIVHSEFA